MKFVVDDGGREAAGYVGYVGDCVVRAIAIATELPYQEVYDGLFQTAVNHRPYMARLELQFGKEARRHASPRNGVDKKIYHKYLTELGWAWEPTMAIGSGCKVHLRDGELPMGRLVVRVSQHLVAVVDGVIHDTYDGSRNGNRCVYGYFQKG
jgi:hypothetical protein